MANAKTLGRVWAASPLMPTRDPGEVKWKLGFVAEIPTYQVLNFIHNRMDNNMLALAERGIFEWGGDVTYNKGAMAWDENGKIYLSKVASPDKTKKPSVDSAQWEESVIQTPKSKFTTVENALNSHTSNVANPHKLTAAQLNSYTKAEYDALIKNTNDNLSAHMADYGNSHKVTAAQAGAVPITGGTYTGQVTFSTGSIGIGANFVKSESNKVFLKKGNLELGINADGKPYFKNATETLLLDEALFVQLKKVNEKLYAVPLPDVEYDFMSDTNTLRGMGDSEFVSAGGKSYQNKAGSTVVAKVDEPRHTKKGLAFIDSTETLRISRRFDGKAFLPLTEHIEFYLDSISNTGVTEIALDDYAKKDVLYISGGKAYYRLDGNIITTVANSLTVGRNTFTRVLFADNSVKYYWNGELTGSSSYAAKPDKALLDWTRFMNVQPGTVNTAHFYMQRFRCWAAGLTPEQVSTL